MSEPGTKPARSCGGCTACCKPYEEDPMPKKRGQWCPHCAIGNGCKIYEARPNVCRSFRCLWLDGRGEDDERPDKTRIVMDLRWNEDDMAAAPLFRIAEVSVGALDTPYAKKQVAMALNEGFAVYRLRLQKGDSIILQKGKSIPKLAQKLIKDGVAAFETDIMVGLRT